EFHLRIPPYRSLILIPSVLDVQEEAQGPVPAAYIRSGQQSGVIDIDSGQIHFDWQGEARHGLPSWLRLDPSYSGTLAYTWTMDIPPSELEALNRVILDLGQVEEIAEVEVNGTVAGFSFVPPYRFDVMPWLAPGLNRFKVCVTNVVSNRMSKAEVLEDAGPEWKERREQFSIPEDGGLLGPVRLEFHHTIGSERHGYRQ
ncbi:glycosylhydrolase-like jelly roll fold domain-containing protein, partial [[Kitasatospora] papulosa]|uniref:glycosylhydrolase-like jelly roll fold domain-containing protein n=1 Tax=[Kitasatospora] papulosa TaxID=1464011 RepID=UPI0036E6E6AC